MKTRNLIIFFIGFMFHLNLFSQELSNDTCSNFVKCLNNTKSTNETLNANLIGWVSQIYSKEKGTTLSTFEYELIMESICDKKNYRDKILTELYSRALLYKQANLPPENYYIKVIGMTYAYAKAIYNFSNKLVLKKDEVVNSSSTSITDTLTDLRDGRKYKTVKIGNQIWMSENLNANKFRNGDTIPEATTIEEWNKGIENKQPFWCYYNFDKKNGENIGKLYNIYCVIDSRGLAPTGYKIPSKEEFEILSNFLGGKSVAGKKMKSFTGWTENCNGTDDFGFNGKPSGFFVNGKFDGLFTFLTMWSCSSGGDITNSNNQKIKSYYAFELSYRFDFLGSDNIQDIGGFSIRCLKD